MELFTTLLLDGTLFAWLATAGAFIGAIVGVTIKIYKTLEKYRNLRNEADERNEKIENATLAIEHMQRVIKDVEEKFNAVMEKMDELDTKIDEREKQSNKERRIDRKDRIRAIYNKCQHKRQIKEMDHEVLLDLIDSYERAGGLNSFVHEIVIPQMKDWEIIANEGDNHENPD